MLDSSMTLLFLTLPPCYDQNKHKDPRKAERPEKSGICVICVTCLVDVGEGGHLQLQWKEELSL